VHGKIRSPVKKDPHMWELELNEWDLNGLERDLDLEAATPQGEGQAAGAAATTKSGDSKEVRGC
jgi:hypothetical protein